MRVSREQMDKHHARIVEGAARLLRECGVEATGVADVMGQAGLTQGGFYRHFDSKDAMLTAAVQGAFDQMIAGLEARFEKYAPDQARANYKADYLSAEHLAHPGLGCPLPTLAADIGRGATALKAAFGAGFARAVTILSRGIDGPAETKRTRAIRELAMLAGAVALARASDPDTAREILEACRD